jgi:hypothetical protein
MRGVRVFYDQFEQTSLWGQDLVEALDRVYRLDSTFVVMFISLAYRDKEWTRHERRSALSAALASPDEYVLPARFDSAELPGLRPSIGYVSLQDVAPTALGEVIVAKLRKRGVYVHEGILRLSQGGYLGWRVLARKYDPLSAQGAALFGRPLEQSRRTSAVRRTIAVQCTLRSHHSPRPTSSTRVCSSTHPHSRGSRRSDYLLHRTAAGLANTTGHHKENRLRMVQVKKLGHSVCSVCCPAGGSLLPPQYRAPRLRHGSPRIARYQACPCGSDEIFADHRDAS